MNDRSTPETDAEHAQFAMGGFTLDFCRKLERERDKAREDATNYYAKIGELEQERDEARENLDEETKLHHRTHSELVQTQCQLMDVRKAIITTLEENRHLADGDDCTLAKLKSVVPEWK